MLLGSLLIKVGLQFTIQPRPFRRKRKRAVYVSLVSIKSNPKSEISAKLKQLHTERYRPLSLDTTMNKIILSVISLACMVAMATAMYSHVSSTYHGGYGYAPMYYGGAGGFGAGGAGLMGGNSFFSIIIFLFILSFLGNGTLFGGSKHRGNY